MSGDRILTPDEIPGVVQKAINSSPVIDVHTHLFPPSHGELMLWGIDELLTYHYLVSEYFMVAPAEMTHDRFFTFSKQEQADLIWKTLFVERLPISEAQIGVITTLKELGLGDLVNKKDLLAIRRWFSSQDPDEYVEKVFSLSGVKYVVMTNIPFDEVEASKWDAGVASHSRFKAALRIDPLLKGDWGTIRSCVKAAGLPESLEGAKEYLRIWARKMNAIYLMASTPADFKYGGNDIPKAEGWPSATQLIDEVMVPVAKELSLPLAMKFGAWRGMVPGLNPCGGGDAVVISEVEPLVELCSKNPQLKFLATFLSRVNQHQVCVAAQKLRNLHIYGCWWFCNNPSMIDEITRMRLEMLGSAFTAQHSDARVLDQLIYKWKHSRVAMSGPMIEQFRKLSEAGWPITETEIERDVYRLLGGSYEEFMQK